MAKDLVQKPYDPEEFRELGHKLIDQLSLYMAEAQRGEGPVLPFTPPSEMLDFWKGFLHSDSREILFAETLKQTTRVHHPRYMGHQVAPPLPLGALMALLGASLNNGMAVYEMGMAPTAMERVVTDWLCRKLGYGTSSRGILTSGGSLANLTALLTARRNKAPGDIWNNGQQGKLAILVSEAAHYCVDRAARIMGLGEAGVLKVPVQEDFSMDTSKLPGMYEAARQKGLSPFAIVGSAPCTATGSYDNLEAIADFAKEKDLWFHVDGAHGGPAVLSEKFGHLVKGIAQADSVVIDGHKMMGMPVITTALLYREGALSYTTFSQEADYLLTDTPEEDWYNGAKRTFECTKLTSSLSWYAVLSHYGETIFEDYLNRQYELARTFADLIRKRPHWELACEPQSNIVCFRYTPPGADATTCNQVNGLMRQRLLEEGRYYIVQTRLKGLLYLRTSLMSPFTTSGDLKELMRYLEELTPTPTPKR